MGHLINHSYIFPNDKTVYFHIFYVKISFQAYEI
jgi:hypothetical protein